SSQSWEQAIMPWLTMLRGETPERAIPLVREVTILGRDSACDVAVDDHDVSKRHARIVRTGDGYEIEDLGSTNGPKVGDDVLTVPERLKDGDRIGIGTTVLVFSDSSTIIKSTVVVSTVRKEDAARPPGDDRLTVTGRNARYRIIRLLGQGSFGRVYL